MRFTAVYYAVKVGELTKKYSNLPEKYIKRCTEQVFFKTPPFQNYLPRVDKRNLRYFDLYPPWTKEFQNMNRMHEKQRKIYVEPIKEWSFFKGDRVQVLVGKDKGKQGFVLNVIQERNWVTVQGLNLFMKLIGKTKAFPGYVSTKEAPLLVTTDVSLVDPSDLQPTKILWRFTEKGERVRVSERTGKIIPLPVEHFSTYDYFLPEKYKDKKKDTALEDAVEITFSPQLTTFEMDIMKQHGIEEDRVPAKFYYY